MIIMTEQLGFRDVMIRPENSTFKTRADVNLITKHDFWHARNVKWEGIPIICANMDTVGTFSMGAALSFYGISTAITKCHNHWYEFFEGKSYTPACLRDATPEYTPEELCSKFLVYTMGAANHNGDAEYFFRLRDKHPHFTRVLIDCANGYMDELTEQIRRVRKGVGPDVVIIAGNVVTSNRAIQLGQAGADIVKVGIGSGSVCTTRKVAGVGRPQVSTIVECKGAALTNPPFPKIMSDGGCVFPGDVAKSFVAGADFVMLGGMFAGHQEIGLDPITIGTKNFYEYRGMSSYEANMDRTGTLAVHRAAEGKRVLIPAKPDLGDTVQQLLGGLRSAGTYIGEHLQRFNNAHLYKVREQTNDCFGSDE